MNNLRIEEYLWKGGKFTKKWILVSSNRILSQNRNWFPILLTSSISMLTQHCWDYPFKRYTQIVVLEKGWLCATVLVNGNPSDAVETKADKNGNGEKSLDIFISFHSSFFLIFWFRSYLFACLVQYLNFTRNEMRSSEYQQYQEPSAVLNIKEEKKI